MGRVDIEIYNNNTRRPNILAQVPKDLKGRLNLRVSFQGQDVTANIGRVKVEQLGDKMTTTSQRT